jgi:hypothetical protein
MFMNKIVFALVTFLSIVSFAGPEDRDHLLLECRANGVYGIDSFIVTQDRSQWTEIHVVFSNKTTETRPISNKAVENMYWEDLFVAKDGSLDIILSKRRMDQNIFDYYLELKGDGYNRSEMIDCNEN